MKQKLLLLLIGCLFSLSAKSQVANTPPNIHQCGWEVFDLTVQNDIILGNQNPSLFSVSYFTNISNANANVNAIANPANFVGNASQIIFARVTNVQTDAFAVTSFNISWNLDGSLVVYAPEDVTVCGSYALPTPSTGNFYASPNGGGLPIAPGTVITSTQTLYLYAQNGGCTAQQAFTVTVIGLPDLSMPDVYACESFILPDLPPGASYFSGPMGTGNLMAPGQAITQSMTVYVYAEIGSCSAEEQFTVTIGEIQVNDLSPIHGCGPEGVGTFDLSGIAVSATSDPSAIVTIYVTMADAQAGVNDIATSEPFLSGTATLWVRVQSGNCFEIVPLSLIYDFCTGNALYGFVTVDIDNNGCTNADPDLSGIAIIHTFNGQETLYYTNSFGIYYIQNVLPGDNTVALDPSTLPAGVSGTASSQTITFTEEQNENVSFCVTTDGSTNDLSITVSPNSQVVPGFQTAYRIKVMNSSPVSMGATVVIDFDGAKFDFSNSTPMPTSASFNSLTYTFSSIPAYTGLQFYVYFDVATPPTANSGDVVVLSATVTNASDVNPENNTASGTQTVINSYDPNDITVHEGATITPTQAQGYLHYTIRFQNMGTAEAQNVRIENELSDLLDWSTFRPIFGSHGYYASRSGNQVTFSMPQIHLVPESVSEIDSQGFVTYEIKPIAGIEIGDIIANSANIFFDFNEAVPTNEVETTVAQLSAPETALESLELYPNPTSGSVKIHLATDTIFDVEIADVRGAIVFAKILLHNDEAIDVSGLHSGIYFVKINSGTASATKKLIVK
ncbi:T9SS type A sorting domain-containing protein [Flavobacterium sp. MAH-1]|uniref:T9SS type A sorting domain-containing protein n=1 Tax=Flavobacterium agri TaxID=2743471 RepID=A0A7Y8Y3A0_9FLAO|nr:T9SS type A sorting domain-containing protein [Flavobacterium agri]NUY81536.1 T9SS type A sorting domain-containing protein [Flavobacterium agri]NYA71560.1 T9SS type A sorting domain-containing protein [Flavobacterium agri]